MPSKKTAVAAAAGVLTLGAGLGAAGLASADPTTSPSASPSSSSTTGPGADGRHGPGGVRSELAAALAEKLGATEARVTEALQAIREANRPTAAPSAGTERPDPGARYAELAGQLADELGVTEARVQAALDEIRAERQSERAAALQTRLDEAVQAGTLTQAEADAVTKAVEKGVIGGGFGRR